MLRKKLVTAPPNLDTSEEENAKGKDLNYREAIFHFHFIGGWLSLSWIFYYLTTKWDDIEI